MVKSPFPKHPSHNIHTYPNAPSSFPFFLLCPITLLMAFSTSILGFLFMIFSSTSKFLDFSPLLMSGSNLRFFPVPLGALTFPTFGWNLPKDAVALWATCTACCNCNKNRYYFHVSQEFKSDVNTGKKYALK